MKCHECLGIAVEICNRAQADESTAMKTRMGDTVAGVEEGLFVLKDNILKRLVTEVVNCFSQIHIQNFMPVST